MQYDFDKIIPRKGTYSEKWDAVRQIYPEATEKAIPMFVADMDFPSPKPVVDAMHRVADFQIYGYTTPQTEPEFARSLCRWFENYHHWTISPEEVIVSSGTFGALEHGVKLFTEEGDGVILMPPVYGHFADAIENEWHRKVAANHLLCDKEGDYTIDFNDLEVKCANPKNRVLIFCSPANPVGRVWTTEEILQVEAICTKHDVFVIADEVHCDHLRRGVVHHPYLSVCKDKSRAMAIVGVNKSFNMAGLSCSNAIIQDKGLREKFLRDYVYPQPGAFAVAGQIAAYNEGRDWMEQVCAYIEENIDFAIDFFHREMPKVKVKKPQGTYCLWLDFREYGLSEEDLHRRIYKEAQVILQDGIIHDPQEGQGRQRMCVPCPRPLLKEALERLAAAFEDRKS